MLAKTRRRFRMREPDCAESLWESRERAPEQILQARLRRRRHGDRVAIAAQSASDPNNMYLWKRGNALGTPTMGDHRVFHVRAPVSIGTRSRLLTKPARPISHQDIDDTPPSIDRIVTKSGRLTATSLVAGCLPASSTEAMFIQERTVNAASPRQYGFTHTQHGAALRRASRKSRCQLSADAPPRIMPAMAPD